MAFIVSLLTDYTVQIVVLGTVILGLTSGALGSFAVLRQQSLLGDAIAHATLPGICVAFLMTHSKSSMVLLFGAAISGWLATLVMTVIIDYTALKKDAALGIVLSVFFGIGLTLLTFVQKSPVGTKSGLTTFLFGNASTLLKEDVVLIFILSCLAFLGIFLFWKEFKLITFDPEFAVSMGFSYQRLNLLLTSILVLSIVIGLQTVGVVLMSAMIIAPATAARQWTDRLATMVILSGIFGAFSGVFGSLISSVIPKLPNGPTIVLVVSSISFLSLLFAPNRGLVFAWYRRYRNRRQLQEDVMVSNLLLFSESFEDPCYAHDIAALESIGEAGSLNCLTSLKSKGLVHSPQVNFWGLTEKGVLYAQSLGVIDQ